MASDPSDNHLILIDPLLRALGYDSARAAAIITYCWLWGTAQGCPQFRAEVHRTAVEDLLPDADPSQWEQYAGWVWSITRESTESGAA